MNYFILFFRYILINIAFLFLLIGGSTCSEEQDKIISMDISDVLTTTSGLRENKLTAKVDNSPQDSHNDKITNLPRLVVAVEQEGEGQHNLVNFNCNLAYENKSNNDPTKHSCEEKSDGFFEVTPIFKKPKTENREPDFLMERTNDFHHKPQINSDFSANYFQEIIDRSNNLLNLKGEDRLDFLPLLQKYCGLFYRTPEQEECRKQLMENQKNFHRFKYQDLTNDLDKYFSYHRLGDRNLFQNNTVHKIPENIKKIIDFFNNSEKYNDAILINHNIKQVLINIEDIIKEIVIGIDGSISHLLNGDNNLLEKLKEQLKALQGGLACKKPDLFQSSVIISLLSIHDKLSEKVCENNLSDSKESLKPIRALHNYYDIFHPICLIHFDIKEYLRILSEYKKDGELFNAGAYNILIKYIKHH